VHGGDFLHDNATTRGGLNRGKAGCDTEETMLQRYATSCDNSPFSVLPRWIDARHWRMIRDTGGN